jgi:putative SOS response-associated peptidase YedK
MCGRFALIDPAEQLALQFDLPPIADLTPRYNIAPTQPVLAVRQSQGNGTREWALLRWGLIPSWSKDVAIGSRLINARGETVADKPSFRAAFKRRRCLIPASGFYEWQKQGKTKQPIFITPVNGGTTSTNRQVFALAGLWESWSGADGSELETCTIVTTTPNELIVPIHNRMPVIVAPEEYDTWLYGEPEPSLGLHLIRPYPSELMRVTAVSTYVNSPYNEGPQCVTPVFSNQ